ncbi:conjugative transposon protein TraM [Parabacteroides merdae]|uniref:conjugative transposon protein TraM n=1 Tax=Parabacteroides merdae TaxID=46503 RepID=UPI003569537A
MEKIKELLKDKNKLLMLVPLLLGILFVVVFFGKQNTEEAVIDKENQSLLEPKSEGEKKLKTKLDAYRKEKEEAERKKRELEESKVAGSDFYFDMQSSDEEYDKKMKERIAKMQRDPLDKVSYEYRGSGGSSFSSKMRKQLEDIEDQETFDQIVSNAQKDERIRKELEKHKQFRDEMRRKYLAESSDEQEDDIFPKVKYDTVKSAPEPIFIVENGKRKRRSQFSLQQKTNLIKAAIYGDQTIVSGSAVRMRLLEPLWVGGVEIPANTIFYGNASIGASRLKITVENIRYGKYISPVAFTIFDSDAIEGLNLPNNMKAEAARKMEQGLLQGVQLPISSIGTVTSEVTSAITATTQVAKQILNQRLSQVKVHLKANYVMYIKEETDEDRKKRKEEEAEIERLYKEMLIQQNAPVKKNPLTKLIEAL